ncbi:MAG: class I SAM-dependent rRNA methyltransferase [Candidatus Kapaibacterium sp.]
MIPELKLRRNAGYRLSKGHLWVFSNELESIPSLEPGTVVSLKSDKGKGLGLAFFNPRTLIALRLLNTNEVPDKEFFRKRIEKALELRLAFFEKKGSFRLVFGESDYLPGLVIDKYNEHFVMQIHSAGMEYMSGMIVGALLDLFPETKSICTKHDSRLREMEGLSPEDNVLYGQPAITKYYDEGIDFRIDLTGGQKTGFYLDQRYNRHFLKNISKGKSVLDCFTNQGGFALNAAFAGASIIKAVDSSEDALTIAEENALMNGFKNIEFISSDVFDFLDNEQKERNRYDIVVLDPPAFAKSKKNIPQAAAAYTKLNRDAAKLVNEGGYLCTSSCSHHVGENDFSEAVSAGIKKAGRQGQLVYKGHHPHDHPAHPAMPETFYLKFLVFRILS